jgi:hypothetical protein
MIQQSNWRLPLFRVVQLSQRTARVTEEASLSGPSVRSIQGSPLWTVIGILAMCLPEVDCWRMCAMMAYKCGAGHLPLLFVYLLGGGGIPSGGCGRGC